MNAAGVGRLAGNAQFARRVPSGEITWRVKTLDWVSGNRCELGKPLGRFLQRRAKQSFLPSAFSIGRSAGDFAFGRRSGFA
jgi:hypothetical protein